MPLLLGIGGDGAHCTRFRLRRHPVGREDGAGAVQRGVYYGGGQRDAVRHSSCRPAREDADVRIAAAIEEETPRIAD